MTKVKVSLEERLKFKIEDIKNIKIYNVVAIHYDINFNQSVLELQSFKRDEEGNFDKKDITISDIERGEYKINEYMGTLKK